jgi:hypothetical protein
MPWTNNPTIDALRRKYNVAIGVHQDCARALMAARASGVTATSALEEAETNARDELTLARDHLLAAVTAAITGQVDAELGSLPPDPSGPARTS